MINIRKLEAELWESADLLRQGSKLTSNQYCMPVLGLIFLRYAFGRFKLVEAEILKDRPVRRGRVLPVEASVFAERDRPAARAAGRIKKKILSMKFIERIYCCNRADHSALLHF